MTELKFATLVNEITGPDSERAIKSAAELASCADLEAVPHKLAALRHTNHPAARNLLAIELSDTQVPAAFDVLVDLVRSEHTKNSRGTLLYALGVFDCSSILTLLIGLVIEGNFEESRQAFALIEGIETELDENMWRSCVLQIDAAIEASTDERRPILESLKEMFQYDS